ncbi:MAG: YihY/virulence factor BrkB family protein [Sandaracinaceae bacterium]|nr:YihY/virulence factor BrkB family protein [Sandaracinaceae bacterium]
MGYDLPGARDAEGDRPLVQLPRRPRLGAATAFYAILSVAPTLLIAVVVTGAVTNREEARRQIVSDLALWIGGNGATTVGEILDHLGESGSGPFAGVFSVVVLLWASTRLFSQLRYSLNHLWGVREVSGPSALSTRALRQARRRLSALTMVFVVVIVLTLTVLGKTALSAAARHFGARVDAYWHVVEFGVSFTVLTVLCIAIFKVLPAVRIGWRDAWIGAVVTALLFSVGAAAVGWYLGFKGTSSTYGAAGSLVALLLWVYYSAQAFFLGAAFTRAHAERHGCGLALVDGAVRVVEAEAPPPERASEPAA